MIKIKGVYLFYEADMRVAFRAGYHEALFIYGTSQCENEYEPDVHFQDYIASLYELAEQTPENG